MANHSLAIGSVDLVEGTADSTSATELSYATRSATTLPLTNVMAGVTRVCQWFNRALHIGSSQRNRVVALDFVDIEVRNDICMGSKNGKGKSRCRLYNTALVNNNNKKDNC